MTPNADFFIDFVIFTQKLSEELRNTLDGTQTSKSGYTAGVLKVKFSK